MVQAATQRAARAVRVVALPGTCMARLGVSEGASQALPEAVDGMSGRCFGHFSQGVFWRALGGTSANFL